MGADTRRRVMGESKETRTEYKGNITGITIIADSSANMTVKFIKDNDSLLNSISVGVISGLNFDVDGYYSSYDNKCYYSTDINIFWTVENGEIIDHSTGEVESFDSKYIKISALDDTGSVINNLTYNGISDVSFAPINSSDLGNFVDSINFITGTIKLNGHGTSKISYEIYSDSVSGHYIQIRSHTISLIITPENESPKTIEMETWYLWSSYPSGL